MVSNSRFGLFATEFTQSFDLLCYVVGMLSLRRRYHGLALCISAAVALLVSGCAPPAQLRSGATSGVGRIPWGSEYDALAEQVNYAIAEMAPPAGFTLAIASQPTAPDTAGNTFPIREVHLQRFRRGTYRLTTYCAGSGTVSVSFTFSLGSIHSVGMGNSVTCEPGTTVSVADVDLPFGANSVRIETNYVDLYGEASAPQAAIAFTIERTG